MHLCEFHSEYLVKTVKVSEFRHGLTKYLAAVLGGESLLITSRGKVVAEISPPIASRDEISAARARLRGSVKRYANPLDPVIAPDDWNLNR